MASGCFDRRRLEEIVMRHGLPSLFVALVAWGAVSPPSCLARSDEIDDVVTARMEKRKVPGLSLAVIEDGNLIKAKGYGLASVELKVPATAETIYQSGSVGKQFAATLVMMLVEQGTISLSDPIVKYFEHAPEAWKAITVRHLLSHTAGISNRAAGYRLVGGQLKNQEWVSPTLNSTADGSLYLTVLDLVKWDAALRNERLLKHSSLEQMWTRVKLNDGKTAPYGFGWQPGEIGGRRIIEHGGAWQGFTSHIAAVR